MLIGFGGKNFYCFKEGVEVSLKLKKNCPKEISNGKKYTDLLCVKGNNASGKTSVLKIITFLAAFCQNSFNYKPEELIPLETFFHNEDQSEFYFEFISNGVEYRYEVVLTLKEVIKETIFRKVKRFKPVLTREYNEITHHIQEIKEIEVVKLRSNASIISTAHQYSIESELFKDIYTFTEKISSNVNMFGLSPTMSDFSTITRFYHDFPKVFKFAKKILMECDLGISNIEIKKKKDPEEGNIYYPVFTHKNLNTKKKLFYESQSSGTKSLYKQLWLYMIALDWGGILILDEFDINLHPHILPVLLRRFTEKKTNPNNAQLIFTTHQTEILDFLGKHKSIFVNKEDNESYSYKLDELSGNLVRNDRSLIPLYNSGKIGGVPNL